MIAVVTMLVDHIGVILFSWQPEFALQLRMVGRLAFPIFCFLIAEGYIRTRDVPKYAFRLLLLALLSEIPYDMFVNLNSHSLIFIDYNAQNVFFALLLGLLAVWAIDVKTKLHRPAEGWTIAVVCMLAAALIRADYSMFGVAWMVVFFVFRGKHSKLIAGFLIVLAVRYILALVGFHLGDMLIGREFIIAPRSWQVEWAQINLIAGLALPLIFLYNGRKGYNSKWVQWGFYAFYPLHMVILLAIHRLM